MSMGARKQLTHSLTHAAAFATLQVQYGILLTVSTVTIQPLSPQPYVLAHGSIYVAYSSTQVAIAFPGLQGTKQFQVHGMQPGTYEVPSQSETSACGVLPCANLCDTPPLRCPFKAPSKVTTTSAAWPLEQRQQAATVY